jgi:hypothetical protein
MYVRNPKSTVTFEHSFDGGRTWTPSFAFNDTAEPWDDLHDQVTTDIPPGTKSVLFKYILDQAALYSVRMEVNHKVDDATAKPVEVTFNWSEEQKDYSLVERAHTQLVENFPFTYTINVGGEDHPVMNSLRINAQGAAGEVKPGYSDGKDAGGEEFVGKWATYGKNLAEGKPYTLSVPPSDNRWGAGDPGLKKLTDGVVGGPYSGGASYSFGALWNKDLQPDITVDLGQPQKCSAFRIHINGYPHADAIKGQVRDKIEVLTSSDGNEFTSRGECDFNLRGRDVPVNQMWSDERKFAAHNHTLVLPQPAEARYVRFKLTPARMLAITEVQALESIAMTPFDLKLALPNMK